MPTDRPTRVAFVYDFDGTLAQGNMQEFGLLQDLGVRDIPAFWEECQLLAIRENAMPTAVYMRRLLELSKEVGRPLTRDYLAGLGRLVPLFKGLPEWFGHIGKTANGLELEAEHYIISSGLAEMIEGTAIYGCLERLYACRYHYPTADRISTPTWATCIVDYTQKTQFIARISKGILDIGAKRDVNEPMPQRERPIPFSRIIYLGDGSTDIPAMQYLLKDGGHPIAVFNPDSETAREAALRLERDQRTRYIAAADYRQGTDLYRLAEAILRLIASQVALEALASQGER